MDRCKSYHLVIQNKLGSLEGSVNSENACPKPETDLPAGQSRRYHSQAGVTFSAEQDLRKESGWEGRKLSSVSLCALLSDSKDEPRCTGLGGVWVGAWGDSVQGHPVL